MKKSLCSLFALTGAFSCFAFTPDIASIESAWIAEKYPAGSIQSVDEAEAVLSEIERARNYSEKLSEYSRKRCSENFFVNSCEDDVRKARQRAERRFIAIEVEAKKIVRSAKATREQERQTARNARHAQGPKDPFPKKNTGTAKTSSPESARFAQSRAEESAARQEALDKKVEQEAENEHRNELRIIKRNERAAEREKALKKRAAKRTKQEGAT